MKKIIYSLILSFFVLLFTYCGTQKSATQLAEERKSLIEKIENQDFKFKADYVIPLGKFQPRHLTSVYDVKITQDTVYSHLPYFGVAYEAPTSPIESPLIFNSTDFDYFVEQGKRSGSWTVNLKMNVRNRSIKYIFTIFDNGSADLIVWDASRQTISFRGEIE